MSDPLVLKKYSNRRLYDTHNSCYVTLDDVANMIREGQQVQIQDATSGEDVTAFILTQIVMEAAKRNNILLPAPVLHLIIRYGDNALNDFFDKYFQKTIQNYIEAKNAFEQQFGQWLDMGLQMSRQLPDMMGSASSMDSMMEMFGYKPPQSKASQSKEAPPQDQSKTSASAKTSKKKPAAKTAPSDK
ncbi:PhaR: predicted polyhydroxyalkanoate synthesis repressor [Desulfosarcina variabilis str. Montpellier]|uniref:polyhydroxyalkanoate synthesis regulator DNA-binding domain-containing protein n=1 Tax=Desulfosarcina variabilis TaxID=2300 RepID=UPI003AFA5A26